MKALLTVLIPVSIAASAGVASAAEPVPPESATAPVESTSSGPSLNHSLSAFVDVGYGFGYATGLGVSGRYQFILVPDGFIDSAKVRDEFGLEVGLDFFHVGWSVGGNYSYSYNEFTPVVGAVWNFWLSDKFALYPKIDLGYHIGTVSATVGGQSVDASAISFSALYFQGTGGLVYRVSDAIALRAEAGWSSLRLGAAITL